MCDVYELMYLLMFNLGIKKLYFYYILGYRNCINIGLKLKFIILDGVNILDMKEFRKEYIKCGLRSVKIRNFLDFYYFSYCIFVCGKFIMFIFDWFFS